MFAAGLPSIPVLGSIYSRSRFHLFPVIIPFEGVAYSITIVIAHLNKPPFLCHKITSLARDHKIIIYYSLSINHIDVSRFCVVLLIISSILTTDESICLLFLVKFFVELAKVCLFFLRIKFDIFIDYIIELNYILFFIA